MKKKIVLVLFVLTLIASMNYKTIEGAIHKASIPYEEILHQIEYDNFTILFDAHGDTLSIGLLKKSLLGYKWEAGGGSDHFSQQDPVTWDVSNFTAQKLFNEKEIITVTKGVIHDNNINELIIHYKDSDVKASIIETSRGRVWYSFSQSPVNYKPDLTIYMDGSFKQGRS